MQPDISRLLEKIRDAGLAVDAWPDALKALSDALGVAGAACIISNKTTGRVDWVCFSGLSAEFQSDYVDHYAPLDPFMPLLNVDWTKLSESLPETALRKSEWYNDFVLPCGIGDVFGARLVETPSYFVSFGLHQQLGRRFSGKTATILKIVAEPLALAARRHLEAVFGPPCDEPQSEIAAGGSRYYFNVRNGRQYPDRTGQTFASHRDAAAHAAVLADELGQDGAWDGFMISVTDAAGRIITQIPVHN